MMARRVPPWFECVWVAPNGRIARVKNFRSDHRYFALASAARWAAADPRHESIVYVSRGNRVVWRSSW